MPGLRNDPRPDRNLQVLINHQPHSGRLQRVGNRWHPRGGAVSLTNTTCRSRAYGGQRTVRQLSGDRLCVDKIL
jgi:hypothetical protein